MIEEIRNEYGREITKHFSSRREADERLNEASRRFIAEYAKIYPNALCIDSCTGESFTPNGNVLNFSCDIIIDAAVANMAKITALLAMWKTENKLSWLERAYREFEKARGENIFWS